MGKTYLSVQCLALGVGPAGGDGAGVHALVADAGLGRGAVRLLPEMIIEIIN